MLTNFEKGMSLAISTGHDHRIAALMFDRLIPLGSSGAVPAEVRAEEPSEIGSQSIEPYFRQAFQLVVKRFGSDALKHQMKEYETRKQGSLPVKLDLKPNLLRLTADVVDLLTIPERQRFLTKSGIPAVPLCHSEEALDLVVINGRDNALEIVASNMPAINAESLSWEQIMEVRLDPDFRDKARNFRLFLHQDFSGKDAAFIQDSIEERVALFDAACVKHGVSTIRTSMLQILDSKSFLGAAGIAAASILAGEPTTGLGALISGAAIECGRFALMLCERRAEFKSWKKNSQLALLMDVRRTTGQ